MAQCPCQVKVSRSTSGCRARAIRSSHHRVSAADRDRSCFAYARRASWSSGAGGRAGSPDRSGGGVAVAPGSVPGRSSASTVASYPRLVAASISAPVGPNPVRRKRRDTSGSARLSDRPKGASAIRSALVAPRSRCERSRSLMAPERPGRVFEERQSEVLAPAGPDQPGLVREDDQLRPVPRAELHHRAADVRLRGRRADHQRAAISSLDSPSPTRPITSRSRSVSGASSAGARPAPGSAARTRRSAAGSPRATAARRRPPPRGPRAAGRPARCP